MKLTQALTSAVQLRKDNIGTIHASRSRNWKEIGRRVTGAAGGFRRLGIETGERIAILALNSDLYIEAIYAIAWAGAVVVPLEQQAADHEVHVDTPDTAPTEDEPRGPKEKPPTVIPPTAPPPVKTSTSTAVTPPTTVARP